jgi:large subunit ribosomal protein L24
MDPKSNAPTRLGAQIILDEKTKKKKRIRVSRVSGEMIQ